MGLDIEKYMQEQYPNYPGTGDPPYKSSFTLVPRILTSLEIETGGAGYLGGEVIATQSVGPLAASSSGKTDISDMLRSGTLPCWGISLGVSVAVLNCGLFSFVGSCTPYPARYVRIDVQAGGERTGLGLYGPIRVLGSDWERFGVPLVKEVRSNPTLMDLAQGGTWWGGLGPGHSAAYCGAVSTGG